MAKKDLETLSIGETNQLHACETIIARGIHAFNEVGNSLMRVRDGRLYRSTHGSFEEYCADRWQISRPRAYQLIEAADTLSTVVDKIDVPLPTNEAQTRELAKVPEADRAEVWTKAHEATGGKPTAASVRAANPHAPAPAVPPADTVAATPTPPVPSVPAMERQDDEPLTPDEAAEVVDRVKQFMPTGPEWEYREWRETFFASISRSARILLFDDADVALMADEQSVEEFGRMARNLTDKHARVVALRGESKIRHLKAVN